MSEPSTPPARRDRADRVRNRERLVAAAREAFADADRTDSPVSLNAIAREAGVGIATLYRHFPTREQLADAVYISKIDQLTSAVDSSTSGAAATDLRRWMDSYVGFMLHSRGMMDTLRARTLSSSVASSDAATRVNDIIEGFLERGAVDGTLRSDLRSDDVTMALLGVLLSTTAEDADGRAGRLLDLLMRGLASDT